jgi:hypothetical protein
MMKGVSKLNGRSDLRLPITVEMMVKLPNALDHVCKSKYESLLLMSAFSLSFSALLRVGEITASNSVDAGKKIIQMSDIRIEKGNIILVIRYLKTDQVGRSAICKIESISNLYIKNLEIVFESQTTYRRIIILPSELCMFS